MQRTERLINWAQTFAAFCLGISCFLPFYLSAVGEVRYAKGEWGLFFWVIPVLFIIHILSNRWLIVVLSFLSAMAGLLDLFLLTFLATFKSTPLIGFTLAKVSIVVLVMSWLILCAISLLRSKGKQI